MIGHPRHEAAGGSDSVTVLESVAAPGETIKYVDQVVRYASPDIHFKYFSWRRALMGKYDIFHVHWPEYLVRGSFLKRRLKRVMFRLLLWRLKVRNVPVVRTVHNLEPHTPGDPSEEKLLRRLDQRVFHRVVLNECSDVPIPKTVIKHGDYREVLRDYPRSAMTVSRVLFFGRIEPYKGILALIDVMSDARFSGYELRIVGRPTGSMGEEILEQIRRVPDLGATYSTRFAFVSDEEMVAEMTAAEFLVLPYQEMHNSGVALVALSLGRPVIVPSSCVTNNLGVEVGDGWVATFDGELTPHALEEAIEQIRVRAEPLPRLGERTWGSIASAYGVVFKSVKRQPRAVMAKEAN